MAVKHWVGASFGGGTSWTGTGASSGWITNPPPTQVNPPTSSDDAVMGTLGSISCSLSTTAPVCNTLNGTGGSLTMAASSRLTISGSGTVWTAPTTFTVNTGEIVLSYTGGSTRTFSGGGKTYYTLTIDVLPDGSTGAVTVSGNNSFSGDLTIGNAELILTGDNSVNGVFTCYGILSLSGTLTLNGEVVLDLPGTLSCQAITGGTLSKSSGTVVAPAGCIITDNIATGGAIFEATSAVNGGGNSGWNFGSPPSNNGSLNFGSGF